VKAAANAGRNVDGMCDLHGCALTYEDVYEGFGFDCDGRWCECSCDFICVLCTLRT
jgi:hypothetical protein